MKKLLVLILLCLTIKVAHSQGECAGIVPNICSNCRSGDITNASDFIPNNSTPVRILRINIHYILTDQGTGNFRANDDGNNNNNYTGYNYATDIINMAHTRLDLRVQPSMPPGNQLPNLDYKFRYVIEGVYFHRNSRYLEGNFADADSMMILWGQNVNNSINVFFCPNNINAFANMTGNRYVVQRGDWVRYINDLRMPTHERWGLWAASKSLNHEIGHNLSLFHTVRLNDGPCSDTHDDFCSDTPTRGNIKTQFGFDACCGWVADFTRCSNNMMDYSDAIALTPLQLGRVHWTILNELPSHRLCDFQNNTLDVTDVGWPQVLYQARNLRIGNPNGQSVLLQNGERAVFVGETEVELRPGFEAQLGSEFEIKFETACN